VREPDFSEVLDTVCRSAGIGPDADAGLGALRSRLAQRIASQAQQLADQALELMGRASLGALSLECYLEHLGERQRLRQRKPVDANAVAEELCITRDMTLSDLARLRRAFARTNHPDLAGSDERDDATRRMMIANMLIDGELRRRTLPKSASER
jgi:hypothetical protein